MRAKQLAFNERRIDPIASSYTYYVGVAPSGALENAANWTIDRFVELPGTAIDKKSATGAWTNRFTLTYS